MRVAAVFLSIAAIIVAEACCRPVAQSLRRRVVTVSSATSASRNSTRRTGLRCRVRSGTWPKTITPEWPAAMARIKNNNQVLALCEMGDCSSCALEKSGTCLEALGLNDATVCSEIEAVKMDGTLQKCFVQNNCCGTWDEFVSTWKAETGLPDCNLGSCAIPPGAVSEVSLDSAAGHNAASLLLSGFFALVLGLHASNRR
eukprot:3053095-Rhodomonas_salina.2